MSLNTIATTVSRRSLRRVIASTSTCSGRNFSSTSISSNKHAEPPKSFATKCAHLYQPASGADRGLATPVYFGSTYTLDDADHGARLHAKKESPYADDDGFVYSRWGTPTNEAAARQIAALEGVEYGHEGGTMLFNSGMSGITSSLMAVLKKGDHAVFPYCVYGGTHEFLKEFALFWGVDVDFVDPTDVNNYAEALRDNTKVVYCESPANPTCRLTDLEAVGKVVDAKYGTRSDNPTDGDGDGRPWVMVDGTFATPYHQRSLDAQGVDVAIQSATKYLGGHSDLLAGAVTSRSTAFLHELAKVQKLITAPLNPMDSFLLARGARTLDVRMQRHGENALKVAKMLEDHPLVETVYYPGLETHPDHDLAKRTFRSGRDSPEDDTPQTFGGMIAFIVSGDNDTALRRAKNVCEGLSVINLAVSLGGVESLVEHPASMTHAMIPREDRLAGGLPDGLVRISVGLERASDLVEDLRSSLDRCDYDAAPDDSHDSDSDEEGSDVDSDSDDDEAYAARY